MKKRLLIVCFLIIGSILFVVLLLFKGANYNLLEFTLSMKAITRQELTLEEMKSSNIYKAYNQIGPDTGVEEINTILNKKSKNIYKFFESWYYPYGYVSMWNTENEAPSAFLSKVVYFETPYTIKLSEKELSSVFECDSLEKITTILGEPILLGITYNKSGEIINSSYGWGIKSSYSDKFIEDIGEKCGELVTFSLNQNPWTKKFRLRVSVRADHRIEKFSLSNYKSS